MTLTIDERLEKLIERHEALTQTVELIVHEQTRMMAEQKERDVLYNHRFEQIATTVESLLHIVQSHEQRIKGLEGQ